jgi:hypothetical protein
LARPRLAPHKKGGSKDKLASSFSTKWILVAAAVPSDLGCTRPNSYRARLGPPRSAVGHFLAQPVSCLPADHLYFQILRHNARTADLVHYLRQLHRQLRRPLILVCDRYSVH